MAHHIGKHAAGVFVVTAELGAAVVVGEGDDGVDAAGCCLLRFKPRYYLLADAVHAAHRGDNPYLVADSDLPVSAAETLEGRCTPFPFLLVFGNNYPNFSLFVPVFAGFWERGYRNFRHRFVFIFQKAGEIRLDAGMIDPAARRSVFGNVPYGIAVLDYVVAFSEIDQSELMPLGHILQEGDA